MASDSTTQLSSLTPNRTLLAGLSRPQRRFLRALVQGMSASGASVLAGLNPGEGESLLGSEKIQEILRRMRYVADRSCRQTKASEAAQVVGVNEAYILMRAKAVEADPNTEPRERVAALKFMAEAIGMTGRAPAKQAEDTPAKALTTAELARIAAKGG